MTCDPVLDWLKATCNGDELVVQLIRACIKAMVLGRTDFQRYLELIGPGGTGKGTLIRLIQALLGRSNTVSTSLSRIAKSQFEITRFMGKRLIFIPDADYNPTAIDVLKQMTGEDYMPWERKGENADYIDGFTLEGWVMVATNKETIASDRTNALFRRRIPVYFTQVVPEDKRRSLLDFAPDGSPRGDLAPCLPGVFNWVMAMPDELMEAYIRNPQAKVEAMAQFQADSLLNTDSLAQWVNEWVVYELGTWTKTGDKNNSSRICLYPNYIKYCDAVGVKPISMQNFSLALENLFQKTLGLDVKRKRADSRSGSGLTNIRLVQTTLVQPDPNDSTTSPTEVINEPIPYTVEIALQGRAGKVSGADISSSQPPPPPRMHPAPTELKTLTDDADTLEDW